MESRNDVGGCEIDAQLWIALALQLGYHSYDNKFFRLLTAAHLQFERIKHGIRMEIQPTTVLG